MATSDIPHHDRNRYDSRAHKTAYIICFSEQETICGNWSKPVLGNPDLRNETRHHPTSASSCPACSPCLGARVLIRYSIVQIRRQLVLLMSRKESLGVQRVRYIRRYFFRVKCKNRSASSGARIFARWYTLPVCKVNGFCNDQFWKSQCHICCLTL